MTCKGSACLPLSQGFRESQGGQGCLEAHLPQGSPEEAKSSGQEGTLPPCPWFAGGAQTPQAPQVSLGWSNGAEQQPF